MFTTLNFFKGANINEKNIKESGCFLIIAALAPSTVSKPTADEAATF